MIKIALIDDEKEVLKIIKGKIESIDNLGEKINIDTYIDVNQALSTIEGDLKYDIIFSDIDMKIMNGIQFGEILKKRYPDSCLIFITSYVEFAVQSYAINAYQYILKDEIDKRLPDILRGIIRKIQLEREKYRIIKTNNDIRKLFYKDIIYIKKMKSAKYVQYFTVCGEYRERITLEKVIEEINDNNFVLIERGYVVNIKHIIRMNGNTIYLNNGEVVVISRARFQEVKKIISIQWRICDELEY